MMVDLIDTTRHLLPRAWPAHRVDQPRCPLYCRRRAEIASLVHRYYDPVTSQFLSVDPLVDETGTPYAYTGGDPVNFNDPAGLAKGGKQRVRTQEFQGYNDEELQALYDGLAGERTAEGKALRQRVKAELKARGLTGSSGGGQSVRFAEAPGPPCPSLVASHPGNPQYNLWPNLAPTSTGGPSYGFHLWLPGSQLAKALGLTGLAATAFAVAVNTIASAGEAAAAG